VSEQRPGEWPVNEPADLAGLSGGEASNDPDEIYVRLASERARREIVLASIRAHLDEQPTAKHTSVTPRSPRRSKVMARSMRRVIRYEYGDSP